jgi:hypothetical protein
MFNYYLYTQLQEDKLLNYDFISNKIKKTYIYKLSSVTLYFTIYRFKRLIFDSYKNEFPKTECVSYYYCFIGIGLE